jgi:hypothetical protein
MDLSVCIAWVFAFTAASRAILRCRIISTVLVPVPADNYIRQY